MIILDTLCLWCGRGFLVLIVFALLFCVVCYVADALADALERMTRR